jgi:hypothetical protein
MKIDFKVRVCNIWDVMSILRSIVVPIELALAHLGECGRKTELVLIIDHPELRDAVWDDGALAAYHLTDLT